MQPVPREIVYVTSIALKVQSKIVTVRMRPALLH